MRFDESEFRKNLTHIFTVNGMLSLLDGDKIDKFVLLTEILLEENEKYNLTAITEPNKIILNHYADCAAPSAKIAGGSRVCDVGCGAGFPSLPLAILRPDISIMGLDSTAKRTAYVAAAAEKLGLGNVRVMTARAEEAGRAALMRERFDAVIARAVANMRVLAELCLPLVRVGGQMIAMKGKNAAAEMEEAQAAIKTLGGSFRCYEEIALRSDEEELSHPLIIVDKVAKTPSEYPRAYGRILKKPL